MQGNGSLDSPSSEETAAPSCGGDHQPPKRGHGHNGHHDNNGEDILAALERIPGVGSLRSSAQSSLASSLPSLALDKLKRDDSSHSLSFGNSNSCHGGNKDSKLLRFNTERPRKPARVRGPLGAKLAAASSIEEEDNSRTAAASASEDHEVIEMDEAAYDATTEDAAAEKMKARPLPELPPE